MKSGWHLALGLACLLTAPVCPGPCLAQDAPPSVGRQFVAGFDTVFKGPYPTMRAVHGNGLVLEGRFVPDAQAAGLSRAAHFSTGTPVIVRFSNFASIPNGPDGSANGFPRGMAIRFLLPDDVSTDIVAHSYDGFPAATPDEFLEFLQAVAAPDRLPALAARRASVQAFLAASKLAPASYGTERFHGVNAFQFTNAAGQSRFARYRMEPLAGVVRLSPAEAAARAPDYLGTEMRQRLEAGPVRFQLLAQLAEPGDDVTDGSVPWPATRSTVPLGQLELTALVPDQAAVQGALQFRPVSLVDGIAPSRDPMLLARTKAYRVSAERREDAE